MGVERVVSYVATCDECGKQETDVPPQVAYAGPPLPAGWRTLPDVETVAVAGMVLVCSVECGAAYMIGVVKKIFAEDQ